MREGTLHVRPPEKRGEPYQRHRPRGRPAMLALTYTQSTILQAIADGSSLEEIPKKTSIIITYDSARSQLHLARIKLGATTTAHAVAIAMRKGIVT